jgi:hypothetical protein
MTKIKKRTALLILMVALIATIGGYFGVQYDLDSKIQFAINDTLSDGAGQKATVILLGGQSNASGCSSDQYLQQNVSEEKYSEYQNGYDNVYINYLSGMNMSQGFVKCGTRQGEMEGCFGPELGLAEKLHETYPDELFFIIKCAWGGTNLYEQWLSPSSIGKTGELYKKFVAFVETSLEYLVSKNYDIQIVGMCWMQGESDSFSTKTATKYSTNLSNFVKDIRKKFSQYAAADGIAFVDAYIAANPAYWVYYESVNQGKKEFAQSSPMNVVVDTIAQGLSCSREPTETPDLAHYDSLSEIKLGHLFAEQLINFLMKE